MHQAIRSVADLVCPASRSTAHDEIIKEIRGMKR